MYVAPAVRPAVRYTVTTLFGTPIHLLPEELKAYAARVRHASIVLDGLCKAKNVTMAELDAAHTEYAALAPVPACVDLGYDAEDNA